jgi:hypothetical protein
MSSLLLTRRFAALRPGERRRRAGVEEASRRLLLWGVLQLWAGSGLAEWVCHRCSDIEHTAGTEEALIHLLMMGEAGPRSCSGYSPRSMRPCWH